MSNGGLRRGKKIKQTSSGKRSNVWATTKYGTFCVPCAHFDVDFS